MLSALLSLWTHMLAAVLFAALTLWRLRDASEVRGGYVVVAGLGATALWAWIVAIEGAATGIAQPGLSPLAETVRNLVWLGFLFTLGGGGIADARANGARIVFASMAAILGLQLALDIVSLLAALPAGVVAAVASTTVVLRITAAAGALVLVHNVYDQATADARGRIRLPMIGLAILWAYDLNLYTIAYLFDRWPAELSAMRGAAAAASVPLFALVRRRQDDRQIELSRVATFQSLSLGAICAYFVIMTIGTGAGNAAGWGWLRAVQMLLLGVMTVATAVLIPSVRARAWLRVTLTKHLFKHRYDYRAEWLRFTHVMGAAGPEAAPVGERVLKAIADIVEAPAGLLLVPGDGGRFDVAARFGWDDGWRSGTEDAVLAAMLSTDALSNGGRIVDFAALREGRAGPKDRGSVPAAMLADARIWAGAPLIHDNRLTGLALLGAPPTARALDWEDFDLLRTAARGAASYLAEARGQEALSQSARFDEFNRRFAFILHDVKNLVSGLTLVARNAERHADNPDFRADMVATLRSSVARMNDLLARLSPQEHANGEVAREAVRDMALTPLLNRIVAAKRRRHDVRLTSGADLVVLADPQRLEQALIHLVDNAIDASTDAPVRVEVGHDGREVVIAVIDRGAGMSADFIRRDLFQPFASTKPGGFGVGAHQARALIAGMGGSLTVDSREGTGTRFDIRLPLAIRLPANVRDLAA